MRQITLFLLRLSVVGALLVLPGCPVDGGHLGETCSADSDCQMMFTCVKCATRNTCYSIESLSSASDFAAACATYGDGAATDTRASAVGGSGGGGSGGGGGLTGTWCAGAPGYQQSGDQNCWVFDNATGSSTGKFYQRSINEYSGILTNTMTWSADTSTHMLTYRFTRSTLSDSAYNYDKAVNVGPYTFPYSLSGSVFTFQNIDFTRN